MGAALRLEATNRVAIGMRDGLVVVATKPFPVTSIGIDNKVRIGSTSRVP